MPLKFSYGFIIVIIGINMIVDRIIMTFNLQSIWDQNLAKENYSLH